ncbi:MAG: type IX secretion system membrane protein PorP/SprF [Bacteroidota bacterium]|nr:type IX secretion system membrane protein PorP/SprF [Bacteroidota bacterium]
MKNIYLTALLFIVIMLPKAGAQDMHFTQFFSSPVYLNPAFAGADVCSRVSLVYRNQWPGVTKTYRSYLFSVDHYFNSKNIGAGILFASDIAGSGDLKTTLVNVPVAYETRLNKKLFMRLAVQGGIGIRSINFNKLLFGDQISRGGNVATLEDPTQTKVFFDLGAGALFYSARYWGGFSAYHLNKPNQSLRGDIDGTIPIRYTVHGGARFAINKEEKEDLKKKFISPAFHYRGQNKFDQLDVGCYYTQGVFNLGLWYRGIPGFKSYAPGYANNDAIAIITGIKTERFNCGYSYDITISKLAGITNGAHEITIAYQLCKLKRKKRYRMLVPCPKF